MYQKSAPGQVYGHVDFGTHFGTERQRKPACFPAARRRVRHRPTKDIFGDSCKGRRERARKLPVGPAQPAVVTYFAVDLYAFRSMGLCQRYWVTYCPLDLESGGGFLLKRKARREIQNPLRGIRVDAVLVTSRLDTAPCIQLLSPIHLQQGRLNTPAPPLVGRTGRLPRQRGPKEHPTLFLLSDDPSPAVGRYHRGGAPWNAPVPVF